MNEDFFRYKNRFITIFLIISYTYLHFKLTGVYADATLGKLVHFTARLPFGQRLLIPYLAHFITTYLPFKYVTVFFVMEGVFVALTYHMMKALFRYEFSDIHAKAFAWLFLLLLPLISVINYRLTIKSWAAFYYPFDTATLFFMAGGYLFCLQKRWHIFIPWIFFATLNRESSVLLVFLVPALHWRDFRQHLKPFFFAMLSYILARALVLYLVRDLPGSVFELYNLKLLRTYFELNTYWLLNMKNFLLFVFCLAGVPLFWFAFYDYIPLRYRPLRYLCLLYFIGLLLVGNFMESRIFGEIFILLYLPVCIAVTRWLNQENPFLLEHVGIMAYLNRYMVISILMLIVLLRYPLNNLITWLVPYS
ncbi:hypothetical protein FOG18_00680 [Legionella israelensis]|uniref:hypothetical protein n=1 Tax=Legionella israelensis TaxID=454 RepID=UPI00117F5A33|nr:hypothetical protein [Legionella israelensis]QDP71201.1 hypothetical protein FOG18_00680 [Legionella israelensis]